MRGPSLLLLLLLAAICAFLLAGVAAQEIPGMPDKQDKLAFWKPDMTELVGTEGKDPPCMDAASCRDWAEIKDVAHCKAVQYSKAVLKSTGTKFQMYYVRSEVKNPGKGKWTKQMYSMVPPGASGAVISDRWLRVCVPTDRSAVAWTDEKCWNQPCGEKPAAIECDQAALKAMVSQGAAVAKPKAADYAKDAKILSENVGGTIDEKKVMASGKSSLFRMAEVVSSDTPDIFTAENFELIPIEQCTDCQ